MAEFKRGIGAPLLNSLKKQPLFSQRLASDIKEGTVFFAGRNRCASFYYKGRSLFTYKNNIFTTNQKFGFVPVPTEKSYIEETDLNDKRVITNFIDAYEKIKERAALYADKEAEGVSMLYKFSPASNKRCNEDYFLIDIEVSLEKIDNPENLASDKKRKGTDRIDMLLYNNAKKQLMFCEAKHYTNTDLWASDDNEPPVVGQLKKYEDQIHEKQDQIIAQYIKVIHEYNELLGTELNEPVKVFKHCGLYVFGYDDIWKGEVLRRLDANAKKFDFIYRAIGGTGNDSIRKIYERLEKQDT